MRRYSSVADLPDIAFTYDGMGNRVSKLLKTRNSTVKQKDLKWIKTYYVRDAQGNVMATYERSTTNHAVEGYSNTDLFYLKEHQVYGSDRLAIRNSGQKISSRPFNILGYNGLISLRLYGSTPTIAQPNPKISTYTTGKKQYELTNHLGNVLATISDNVWVRNYAGSSPVEGFEADIVSATDYYPGGSIMPGRSFNAGTYRYGGAGGQEMDNEIYGSSGTSYTAEYWQYDSRLLRRWNPDPITFPWQSTYATFNNNPIVFTDPFGLFGSRKEARQYRRENNISGRISKGDDGIFSINDSKNGVSYFKDASLNDIPNLAGRGEDGVITSALVEAKRFEGVIDFTIPAARESRVPLRERGRIRQQMAEQLASYNGENPTSVYDFFVANAGQTQEQIVNQRDDRSVLFGSQPGGPNVRYVQDPINPQAVIDLRHMLIIGERGQFTGNTLEMVQWAAGQASGGNYQDYYSNFLGYQFYQAYGAKLSNNPTSFADYVYEFLHSTDYGRLGTDGSINFYK